MTNNDNAPDAQTQQALPIATTATFGTPTVEEFQRVIAYVNELVVGHLTNNHGLTKEQITNPSPEMVDRMTKECGVVEIWTKAAPFLVSVLQELNAKQVLESMRGPTAPKGPMVLGKLGRA